MRRSACLGLVSAALVAGVVSRVALGQESQPPSPVPTVTVDPAVSEASAGHVLPEAPQEAPPPPPHKRGFVVESRLGALIFLGDFKNIAPTAPWWHVDLGYEILSWLAVFGYGELTFTSTSELQGPQDSIAFPIYGFGGGLRVTIHATKRVGLFLEGDAGTLRADVPHNALAILGYGNAEKFSASFGGRLGFEWYPVDHHLAFGLDVGVRDALGFAEQFIGTKPPLMLDASGAIRYTF